MKGRAGRERGHGLCGAWCQPCPGWAASPHGTPVGDASRASVLAGHEAGPARLHSEPGILGEPPGADCSRVPGWPPSPDGPALRRVMECGAACPPHPLSGPHCADVGWPLPHLWGLCLPPPLSMTGEKNLSPESNRIRNLSNYAEEMVERKGKWFDSIMWKLA